MSGSRLDLLSLKTDDTESGVDRQPNSNESAPNRLKFRKEINNGIGHADRNQTSRKYRL